MCWFSFPCSILTLQYDRRLRMKPSRTEVTCTPNEAQPCQKNTSHAHRFTYIHSLQACMTGWVCAHKHPLIYTALPQWQDTVESFTVTDGRTTEEPAALIQSLVHCFPQCIGAFHCTCDKGITGPAGYCATFNNWIAGFGCLATMAGAGDDLVILKVLCAIWFSDTLPAFSSSNPIWKREGIQHTQKRKRTTMPVITDLRQWSHRQLPSKFNLLTNREKDWVWWNIKENTEW